LWKPISFTTVFKPLPAAAYSRKYFAMTLFRNTIKQKKKEYQIKYQCKVEIKTEENNKGCQ
jgi:hypothetical protein